MPSETLEIPLPDPAPGTRHTLTVHRYGHPDARPKAYLQAALHADEWPGLLVLQHLMSLLEDALAQRQIAGEVIVVPIANPIGLAQRINGRVVGRYDLAAGGNFNRGFADLSEPALTGLRGKLGPDAHRNAELARSLLVAAAEALPRVRATQALKASLLAYSLRADYVLDLHCDGEALLHLYAPRAQADIAAQLGAQLHAPVVLLEEEPGGHPFDQANTRPWRNLRSEIDVDTPLPLGAFAATVELRGEADVYDDYAESDARALARFLQRRGVLRGDPGPLPEALTPGTALDAVDVIAAPAAGLIAYRKALGESVEEGEVVAELVSLTGSGGTETRTPIRSRARGILFARMADKLAWPGQMIFKIAGSEPLAHRQPGDLLEDR